MFGNPFHRKLGKIFYHRFTERLCLRVRPRRLRERRVLLIYDPPRLFLLLPLLLGDGEPETTTSTPSEFLYLVLGSPDEAKVA